METDHGDESTQIPQHVGSQEAQAQAPRRSYECTFCRRGFSNAQALGGHMNIHRKDKAKLKQQSSSASSLSNESNLDMTSANKTAPMAMVDENTCTTKPWSLFVDKPQSHVASNNKDDDDADDDDQKGLSSTSEPLDLELRLGPEPNKPDSSQTTGTRKFF